MNGTDFRDFLIWAREGIGDKICLALDIADISCIFRNTTQLITLSSGVRVCDLREGRDERLMISIQCERPSLNHVPEMTNPLEGAE